MLLDKKMLALEGFNKTFGWHTYLMYGKEKSDTIFKHYYIRESLLYTWSKYSKYLPEKKTLWIIPEEVIYHCWRQKEGATCKTC